MLWHRHKLHSGLTLWSHELPGQPPHPYPTSQGHPGSLSFFLWLCFCISKEERGRWDSLPAPSSTLENEQSGPQWFVMCAVNISDGFINCLSSSTLGSLKLNSTKGGGHHNTAKQSYLWRFFWRSTWLLCLRCTL